MCGRRPDTIFSQYKRATILRRVARRLQVNLFEDIPTYLEFLRLHPAEVTALLHDLLISVTNFFRDAEAFAVLESYIPQLFAGKAAGEEVRVWVAGCATGEEAYSVAMLLSEYAARLETPPSIQVFATDLDEDAIQVARAGVYTATIEADVSSERLRRFFYRENGRYRIKKELRERVLFSVHNLLKDSPFSRLDMVTCRNLLIYLKREAQEDILDVFHFALHSSGLLFLWAAQKVSMTATRFLRPRIGSTACIYAAPRLAPAGRCPDFRSGRRRRAWGGRRCRRLFPRLCRQRARLPFL